MRPADGPRIAQRCKSLEQAAKLLNELSEEARQLQDSKEMLVWMEAEQKKVQQAGAQP